MGEVFADFVFVDFEGGYEFDVADVVATIVDVHQPGHGGVLLCAFIVLRSLNQSAGAVADADECDADFWQGGDLCVWCVLNVGLLYNFFPLLRFLFSCCCDVFPCAQLLRGDCLVGCVLLFGLVLLSVLAAQAATTSQSTLKQRLKINTDTPNAGKEISTTRVATVEKQILRLH